MKILLAILFASITSSAQANDNPPKDIKKFIENADLCEHFAGEFDSDMSKQEKNELNQSLITYCGAAKHQLPNLRKKYKNNPELSTVIKKHSYDSVTQFIK